jgi:flagellar motor protein MotB
MLGLDLPAGGAYAAAYAPGAAPLAQLSGGLGDDSQGGGSQGGDSKHRKTAKQQEANKIAQQRYRERKKQKFHEMEAQIGQLSRQLAALQALQSRNQILEGLNGELQQQVGPGCGRRGSAAGGDRLWSLAHAPPPLHTHTRAPLGFHHVMLPPSTRPQLLGKEKEVERLKLALDAAAERSLGSHSHPSSPRCRPAGPAIARACSCQGAVTAGRGHTLQQPLQPRAHPLCPPPVRSMEGERGAAAAPGDDEALQPLMQGACDLLPQDMAGAAAARRRCRGRPLGRHQAECCHRPRPPCRCWLGHYPGLTLELSPPSTPLPTHPPTGIDFRRGFADQVAKLREWVTAHGVTESAVEGHSLSGAEMAELGGLVGRCCQLCQVRRGQGRSVVGLGGAVSAACRMCGSLHPSSCAAACV